MTEKTMTVKRFIPKPGTFDIAKRVKATSTETHPFRKAGESMNISPVLFEHFKLNGWAK